MEEHNSLPFLNIKLHLVNKSLKLCVHQKSIDKNDLINVYPHQNSKIKPDIDIVFYLRELRICSSDYFHDEEK